MESQYPRPKDLIGIIGIIWAFPLCYPAWVFLALLVLAGQIESIKLGPYMTIIVDFKNDAKFCRKAMIEKGWAGYGWGNVVSVVDTDTERWQRTIDHELTHIYQQYFLGILQPIVYFLMSAIIFMFIKSRHSYLDNPFERQARRRAGQPVNLPKSAWPHGSKDRWAWW